MARLKLPMGGVPDMGDFRASVSCRTSPMGVEFAAIAGTPLDIAGRNSDQPSAIWLALLLDGTAHLEDGTGSQPLSPGDIAFGPTGMAARLRLGTPFHLLFINIPRVALTHRIVSARALGIGKVAGGQGFGAIYSAMLRATADALDTLTPNQMRPIELALTEFLVAYLADRDSPALMKGTGRPRGGVHLHRVCQTIESLLAEPDLTLKRIADEAGVSSRYLQKLFAAQGTSFSAYLRLRRLERCRLELASPVYGALSISQISFNWGFNGSSHFSRAFRAQYGVSPREFRQHADAA